jgi:hypothetical protein
MEEKSTNPMSLDLKQMARQDFLLDVISLFPGFKMPEYVSGHYQKAHAMMDEAQRFFAKGKMSSAKRYASSAKAIHWRCNCSLENLIAGFFKGSHRKFKARLRAVPLEVGSLIQHQRIEDQIIRVMKFSMKKIIDLPEAGLLYTRANTFLEVLEKEARLHQNVAA